MINVNLWYSKKDNGEMVTVNNIDENYNGKYYCPLCGSEVIPKAVNSRKVSPHFAHINREECSGESIVHWWVKNELFKIGDVIEVKTNSVKQVMIKNIEFEKMYETPNGVYKPDITLTTYDNEAIFIEVNYHNKKNVEDYFLKWNHLKNTIIEFSIKGIYDENENKINISNSFTTIYYNGMVLSINKNDKDYVSYINSIKKSITDYEIEKLKRIEWFIDDIYKHKQNMITTENLLSSFCCIEHLWDYKDIIVKIYKNKKCQTSIRDIILYLEQEVEKCIKHIINNSNINIEYSIQKISENRTYMERIFNNIEIKLKFKTNIDEYAHKTYDENKISKFMIQNMIRKNIKSDCFEHEDKFNITDVAKYGFNDCINKSIDKINDYINYVEKSIMVINENTTKVKEVIEKGYISKDNLFAYFKNKFNIDFTFIKEQNRFITDDKIDLKTFLRDVMIKFDNIEVLGEYFYDVTDDELNLIFDKFKEYENSYNLKYDKILRKCRELEDDFHTVSYRLKEELYEFYYRGKTYNIVNEIYLTHSGFTLYCLKDIKDVKENINFLIENITARKNNVINDNTKNIYKKIKDIYERQVNGRYCVEMDLQGISIYSTNKYGNRKTMISYFVHNSNHTFKEVLCKLSDDVRKYLYPCMEE